MSTLSKFAAQVSRHAAIYSGGFGLMLLLGFVNVGILTRLLPPSEYGQLGILIFFASLLTLIYSVCTLQGSLRWALGASADEDGDDGDDGDDGEFEERDRERGRPEGEFEERDMERGRPEGTERRRALATGVILTLIISGLGTLVVVGCSDRLAELLLGDPADADLVRLAAASAAVGAVWRFVLQIPRLERRPVAYVVLYATRVVLALAIGIPLVATGSGIRGVLVGLVLGTAVSVLIILIFTRRAYALAFLPRGVPIILQGGFSFLPLLLSSFVIAQADLFLLSRYVSADDLGLYRVASRIALPITHSVSAVTLAWQPLRRTSLYAAAAKERGSEIGVRMITYFAFGCFWMLLFLSVAANGLVRIAGSSYEAAAPLIPLLGLTVTLHGFSRIVYRGLSLPDKRRKYVGLTLTGALVFFPISMVLMPALGAYGAALSVSAVWAVIVAGLLMFSHLGPRRMPIQYRRMGAALLLAGLCWGLYWAFGGSDLSRQLGVALVSILAFPALLVITGVLPRSEMKTLRGVMRSAFDRRSSRAASSEMLERVPASQRILLDRVFDRGSVDESLAAELGMDTSEVHRDFVRILREAGEVGEPREVDAKIGAYLLNEGPVVHIDAIGSRLRTGDEVNPVELDALENVCAMLRRATRKQAATHATQPDSPST
jgi:O-antigen/teichoic acid export membrane protein